MKQADNDDTVWALVMVECEDASDDRLSVIRLDLGSDMQDSHHFMI